MFIISLPPSVLSRLSIGPHVSVWFYLSCLGCHGGYLKNIAWIVKLKTCKIEKKHIYDMSFVFSVSFIKLQLANLTSYQPREPQQSLLSDFVRSSSENSRRAVPNQSYENLSPSRWIEESSSQMKWKNSLPVLGWNFVDHPFW